MSSIYWWVLFLVGSIGVFATSWQGIGLCVEDIMQVCGQWWLIVGFCGLLRVVLLFLFIHVWRWWLTARSGERCVVAVCAAFLACAVGAGWGGAAQGPRVGQVLPQ